MGYNFLVLLKSFVLRPILMKKKPKNRQNGPGLTRTKQMHLLNVFAKKRNRLLKLYRLLFASNKLLRKSFKKLLKSRLVKTSEKLKNRPAKH
jgi:hypothetical protein